MAQDADMEEDDFVFEFTPVKEPSEAEIALENKYMDIKDFAETDPEAAVSSFAEFVSTNPENAKWCYKALRQTVKIHRDRDDLEKMTHTYRDMLKYITWHRYDSLSKLLPSVSRSLSKQRPLLQEFYKATVEAVEKNKKYSPLWFNTNLEFCNFLFDIGGYTQISKILEELHNFCQKKDGADDPDKASKLLEVYAYELWLYTETNDNKNRKMQELHQKAASIKSEKCKPSAIALLRECAGKMYMAERQWAEAANEFRAAFIAYCKDFNQRRRQCLKYNLLASTMGNLDPFDLNPDNKAAIRWEQNDPVSKLALDKNDPEILAMQGSIEAYQNRDLAKFTSLLESNTKIIMGDPFVKTYMDNMLKKLKTSSLSPPLSQPVSTIVPATTMNHNLLVYLVGDRKVGKTSLINKFVNDDFAAKCEPKKVMKIDGQNWNLKISSFHECNGSGCPLDQVCCFVLVFDLTDRTSFDNLTKYFDHFNALVHPHPYKFNYVVIGNKTDKLQRWPRDRAVSKQEAIDWCYSNKDALYFETSAVDGWNVVDAFEQITRCGILYSPYARRPLYNLQDISQENALIGLFSLSRENTLEASELYTIRDHIDDISPSYESDYEEIPISLPGFYVTNDETFDVARYDMTTSGMWEDVDSHYYLSTDDDDERDNIVGIFGTRTSGERVMRRYVYNLVAFCLIHQLDT